jgi:hypothetical protein
MDQHQRELEAATSLRTHLGADLPEPPLKALKEETCFALQEIGAHLDRWAEERTGKGQAAIADDLTRADSLLAALGAIRELEEEDAERVPVEAPGKWSDDPEIAALEQETVTALAEVAKKATVLLPVSSIWRDTFIKVAAMDSARAIAEFDHRMAVDA